ncbi:GGDEF domain-containing protein [Butyrivibrio sp. YAB3001]|uniref:GGDEF domain-containing protein n=1 Tax=Butyrivibrio sp. YAB3001 TaxID=1520812 RepID=UPI0008F675FA|nr:GGDEF domain-containing protein [Butyrivibrio sp. YAB3001]SFB73263.1 diguanylate cyclase (GGDEF) domain-containing protein [Butyrivibrio sp. YAB3001]
MKSGPFHEIMISKENHQIFSADAEGYSIFKSDTLTAIEGYVTDDVKKSFIKNLELANDTWFPTKIVDEEGWHLYYVKASNKNDSDMIKLVLVNIADLMDNYEMVKRQNCAYKAQLDLFEDIFFEYNPVKDTINIFNTEMAEFDAGIYSLSDFEELLIKRAKGRQRSSIKSFIGQIKSKTGRSSVRIDSNLINDDINVVYTLLEEAFVFYDKETEGVVGHIHLGHNKMKTAAASIKHDSLTGLVDKTDIIRIARERIDERRLRGTTLAIIDIDYFKSVNDIYGHQYGDEVLKKIADIISSEVGNDGIAGRFGGDEFLVVFYHLTEEEELRAKLKNIKNLVRVTFADKNLGEDKTLSVSIGAATFPNDADSYDDLFMLADYCLYTAKDKGRNRYVFYTLEKHGTLESIRNSRKSARKINERDLSYGDFIVKMFDMTLHGNGSTLEHMLDEFAEIFDFQHLTLFVGQPFYLRYSTGSSVERNQEARDFMLGVLNSDSTREKYLGHQNFIVMNRIENLPPYAQSVKNFLKELEIYSYVLLRFNDKDGKDCILIISSVGKNVQWNQMHFKYYRAFTDLLGLYSLSQ